MPTGFGIDFGNDSIKLAVVRTGRARPQILAACSIKRGGEGQHTALSDELAAEIRNSRARRRGGLIGLAGRDLMMKYASVPPVPPWKLKVLMEYEIRENQATGLTDICSDYRLLNVRGRGLSGGLLALIAIAKNSYVREMLQAASLAGLNPSAACPSAVALYNAYKATGKMPEKETVFLLDVGHGQLDTAIIQNGELILARSTPGGGGAFTGAIDSVLKIGPERADAFKRERGKIVLQPQPDAGREQLLISTGLREAADAVYNAVHSGVMFCRVQVKSPRLDIDRLVISGGGARMKGLKEYLEKKLGKPVELLDTAEGFDLRRLDGEAARLFDEAGGEMAVAVGLAVADAEADAWKFELLPEEYVARKRFWSKTFWAYAAAVMLVASLAGGYVRALRDLAAAETAGEAVQTRLVEVRGRSSQYEEAAKRNDDLRAEVELLRAQTRYGLTAIEFLRHLRAVTEEGINIEKLFEPAEPDEEALAAGQIVLIVEGRLDKTRIKEPFKALDGYMGALKASDFVADASITTQAEERGPGAKPGDEDRMRFSFKVKLAPSAIKSADAGESGESGRAAEGMAP